MTKQETINKILRNERSGHLLDIQKELLAKKNIEELQAILIDMNCKPNKQEN